MPIQQTHNHAFTWSHEVYSQVAVVGVSAVKFAEIKSIIVRRLGADAAERIHHFRETGDLLATLLSPQRQPLSPIVDVKMVRGRKVTSRLSDIPPEQAKAREEAVTKLVIESMIKGKLKSCH
jgi:hypothetical protein